MLEDNQNKKEDCPLCEISPETMERLKSKHKSELTKKEKYLLKKQTKEEDRGHSLKRQKTKKIVLIALGLIFVGSIIVFGITNYSPEQGNQGLPQVEVAPLEYDAGTVSMNDGLVSHTYEVKNNGEGDLKINNIWTSCMCTTARLKVGDKESGEFGMHSSTTFWSQKISPGETGYLEVVFDPAFHGPEGVGLATRAVYLSTNDPQNKEVVVKLIVDVVL